MTDKELEQELETELGLRIEGRNKVLHEPNGVKYTMSATHSEVALWQAFFFARRELEEKKDAILQSAAKIIEQSKEIERLQRVEFELKRRLESRPESELKVQEIIALIEKLDDFCIEQFKKRLAMYVDEARSLPDCPQQEREDWTSSILYNIKTDLENYLKQIFPVTDSRPESELAKDLNTMREAWRIVRDKWNARPRTMTADYSPDTEIILKADAIAQLKGTERCPGITGS